jgi:heptosyltransferase-3
VVRAGALGDVLLLRRAIAGLARAGHRVGLLAPGCGSVLVGRGSGDVDTLLSWDNAEAASLLTQDGPAPGPLRDALAAFDLAVVYSRSAPLAASLGRVIPRVVTHDPVPGGAGHASEWLCRPLDALGIESVKTPPSWAASAAEQALAAPLLAALPEGFVAVHPGSGSAQKNWPAARFGELVEILAPDRPWLLVEGPADETSAAVLRQQPRAIRASGLELRTLGAVLAQAGLYVGNDSGVTHLAAACGAPTLALFGPTDPAVWSPPGPRVRVVQSPTRRMADLGIEDVLASVRDRPRWANEPRLD